MVSRKELLVNVSEVQIAKHNVQLSTFGILHAFANDDVHPDVRPFIESVTKIQR